MKNGKAKGKILPSFYDLLTMYFYKECSSYFTFNNNIFTISKDIATNQNGDSISLNEDNINQVIDFKKQEINKIVQNLENYYLKSFNEEAIVDWYVFQKNKKLQKEFKTFMANGYFHKLIGLSFMKLAMDITDNTEIMLTKDEFEERVLKNFSISISFYLKNILDKLTEMEKLEYFFIPESDPKKRWNSFYDMQLIFATEYENSYGRKTKLVTSEKKIIECFDKFDLCILTEDYLN